MGIRKGLKSSLSNISSPVSNIVQIKNIADETKHDKFDSAIVKIFPYFIIICLIIITYLFVTSKDYDIEGILYSICTGFSLGFIVLGFFTLIMSDKGYYSWKVIVPIIIILPLIISSIIYIFDSTSEPSLFLINFFNLFEDGVTWINLTITVYSITLMLFLVAYGVVSIIVAYFRIYLNRILNALENPSKHSNKARWFFQIPDIIDIESVELEPGPKDEKFNFKLFANIAISLFILGLAICSYLLLNPFFISQIPTGGMIFISVMLSLFLSPLVIPWSIIKSIGAKVKSQAPRDYYLWKGLKGRLYQGFFAIALFIALIMISAHLDVDFTSVAVTYIGYSIFMGVISIVTSFVYVNTFYEGFKNGLIKRYSDSKK